MTKENHSDDESLFLGRRGAILQLEKRHGTVYLLAVSASVSITKRTHAYEMRPFLPERARTPPLGAISAIYSACVAVAALERAQSVSAKVGQALGAHWAHGARCW